MIHYLQAGWQFNIMLNNSVLFRHSENGRKGGREKKKKTTNLVTDLFSWLVLMFFDSQMEWLLQKTALGRHRVKWRFVPGLLVEGDLSVSPFFLCFSGATKWKVISFYIGVGEALPLLPCLRKLDYFLIIRLICSQATNILLIIALSFTECILSEEI